MNRKQWFTIGIGLIVMGIFFGGMSGMIDCSNIQNDAIERQLNADNIQDAKALSMDDWVISCLDMNIYQSMVSTILWTLGILFIICGFLESKKVEVKKKND